MSMPIDMASEGERGWAWRWPCHLERVWTTWVVVVVDPAWWLLWTGRGRVLQASPVHQLASPVPERTLSPHRTQTSGMYTWISIFIRPHYLILTHRNVIFILWTIYNVRSIKKYWKISKMSFIKLKCDIFNTNEITAGYSSGYILFQCEFEIMDPPYFSSDCVILMRPWFAGIDCFPIHCQPISHLSQPLFEYRYYTSVMCGSDIHQHVTTTASNKNQK